MIKKLKKIKIIFLLLSLSTFFVKNKILAEDNTKKQNNSNINSKINAKNNNNIKDKNSENIYLNFENTSLSSVVSYLSEQKNANIIPIKELDNIKVSLTTKQALTLEQSWNMLLTLLEANGYSLIKVGDLYRIVQKAQSKQQPLPIYSGVEPEKLPDNDKVIRYIYFLKNIKANAVNGFLSTMLEGTVQTNEALDALVITDKGLSIKPVMKIIEELDQGGLRESIKIIKLKHSSAQDVEKLFAEVMPEDKQKNVRFLTPKNQPKNASTYFSRDTKIISETRQNSLILLGLEKNIDKLINFIYKYIDIPMDSAESRLHIKELKYARAENLALILRGIIKPPKGVPKALQVGEYKFFDDVIIAADSSADTEGQGGGNRLIISSGKDDWKRLEKLINDIDKPQPQIAFEVMVVDVQIDNNLQLWSQFKPKKDGMFGKNVNPQFLTAVNSSDIDLRYKKTEFLSEELREGDAGLNVTFGIPGNLWGMIKAVLAKDNFNIIIQPYVTVSNNQECVIDSTVSRFADGSYSSQSFTNSPIRKKEEVKATTKVTLTPKANLNGTIDLKIETAIEDFEQDSETSPNKTMRKIDTKINVGNGEVIILGGLTKSSHTEDTYKVPLLSEIPIVGNLFKSKNNRRVKTNLYIFIRPTIIKPRFNSIPDEYTQNKFEYAKNQILQKDVYSRDKDPIQRWFFKPQKQAIRQKITDAKKGILRPIDNYATGFKQPKSVDLKSDTYYRPDIKRKIKEKKSALQKKAGLKRKKPSSIAKLKRRRKLA